MASYVYAGAAAWVGAPKDSPSGGLFRLDSDSGRWDHLGKGLPDKAEIRCITPSRGNGALYVGTQKGPYKSTDNGESWTALPLPGHEQVVWSILVHPRDPQILYAGTQGTTVYRSRDGGQSWKELVPAEPPGFCRMGFPTRVIDVAIDPGNPDEIYAGLEVGGIVRSRDGGDSWQSCNEGLLAFAEQPQYKSRIGSDTDTEGMMDTHALAISAARPGTLYLANRMGLFRSPDKGASWQPMDVGRFSPLTYARDVQVSPHDPRTMFAALSVAAVSDEGSLYRSHDLGETWQRFDHGVSIESTLMVVSQSAARADRVYCAARRGQVFGTEDGGKSWREHRLPDGVQGVYAIAAL